MLLKNNALLWLYSGAGASRSAECARPTGWTSEALGDRNILTGRKRPSSMPACTSSPSRTRTCGASFASRSRAAGSRTTRWTGTARPAASTHRGPRAPIGNIPGSDPEFVGGQLFDERGVDVAILHPMTRGIMPDRHLGTAIAAAHNEMMVSRWLDDNPYADRYRGTIRVNPDDITGALREVEKYQTTRASCRSASRCSHGRCTASRSTGRCGRRPSKRTCRSRCTSRSVPGSRSRRRRRGCPGPMSSTSASWR